MELSSPNIKKIIFASKESCSYISRNGTLCFSPEAQKNKRNPPKENFLYFRKQKPRKFFYIFLKESLSYISGNKSFLYFRR